MFAVVYRWRLHPGREEAFRHAWRVMTEAIRARHRTHGSRLHRADLGELVAYAVWPSREAWERARAEPSADPAAGEAMRACIAESTPAMPLGVVDDLLHAAPCIEPRREGGRELAESGVSGPIVMLNLLRFRATADYRGAPELAPAQPISGEQAYGRYIELARPFVAAGGGEVLFHGRGGPTLIGPTNESWDAVLLVRQASVDAFFAFATNADYAKVLPHRTAALEDSRLIPFIEGDF